MTNERTSLTDPLRIDELPCGDGLLGLTLCPGKHAPSVFGGVDWERDMEADMAAIIRWGAGDVVTLLEQFELDMLGVTAIPQLVREAGMRWHHLPIVDGEAPDHRFEQGWQITGPRLHQALAERGRILIHCRGGLGRTGTVATRLLMEHGMNAQDAIITVRRTRPGSIESQWQEVYLEELAGDLRAQSEN